VDKPDDHETKLRLRVINRVTPHDIHACLARFVGAMA
jgi:hypothetical protein